MIAMLIDFLVCPFVAVSELITWRLKGLELLKMLQK